MRLPNGYGSVVKLSGTRRKPYMVRKTVGFNEKHYPIYKIIGYAKSRNDGLIMLAEYNHDPYDIEARKMTFKEVYDLWEEKRLPKLGKSLQKAMKSAYKHCSSIEDMKYRDIRTIHMQDCIDNCGCGYSTQGAIKNLFGHLDKFALELDVINKSYAQLTTAEPIPETTKERFTDDEIKQLWKLYEDGVEWADTVLILIYTGFRITEFLNLTLDSIENNCFKGGIKSKSGKNRIIPIHSKIAHIVENRANRTQNYLITEDGNHRINQTAYYKYYYDVLKLINVRKTPHEARHTFRSLLDSAGANKKCIDMLMGHKSKDVGLRRYTHKTVEELRDAIELIRVQ
ncbi:tyrosine-type recombinase/integrase [Massilimicrobiota timonensis]|uniref:Recombinase n=1 Tax=Massilimicrobiota timonensis TaxID=1776392 RepID=A0A1Y4SQW6_9FIRM|nr:tyrosine-type recombinase/integrase [Massilimicrobiota timonensis]OUQ31332.1 recombinase [Massilimicrobiota timonensis]